MIIVINMCLIEGVQDVVSTVGGRVSMAWLGLLSLGH